MKVTMTTAAGDLVVDEITAGELPAIIEMISAMQPPEAAPPNGHVAPLNGHVNGAVVTTNGDHSYIPQEPPLWSEDRPIRNGAAMWTPPPPLPGVLPATLAVLRELDKPQGVHVTELAAAMEITDGAASGRLGDLLTGGHVFRLARGHYRAATKED